MNKFVLTSLTALLGAAGPLAAVQTTSVLQADYAAFAAGEPVNVSLSSLGELGLAPALEQLTVLDDPIIWRGVTDADGNLYLGTGKQGTVYKMTPAGEVSPVFEPEEILSRALALDAEGNLYVGTSPSGRVYRIPPGQRPEIYFDPADEYIWDMIFDQEGNLYVATGADGTIYKLKPDFKPGDEAVKWFKTDRAHVTALAFDAEGNLLAGTAPRAYVYRIAPDGTGTVIYNAGTDEISGISAGADGSVYFSTLHMQDKKNGKDKPVTAQDLPDILEKLYAGTPAHPAPPKDQPEEPAAATAPSLLFRIGTDGFAEPLWSPVAMNICTFRVNADGTFTLGGSENGSLFHVTDLTDWSLLQCAEGGGEVTGLIPVPGEDGALYVLTSNPGAVYKLSGRPAASGTFTSEPVDAEAVAQWGALRVFASPTQEIAGLSWETRTGNSPQPDDTWSPWAPLKDSAIGNPPGRYLQYKAAFDQDSARLRGVRLFYTERNAAPLITRLNLLPVGLTVVTLPPKAGQINLAQLTGGGDNTSFDQEPPPMQQIRPLGEPGYYSAGWRAYDPNGDELAYTVALKPESADEWVTLTDGLDVNVYSFNTRGLADGYYRLQVTATDQPSNPPGEARTGLKVSQPFLVDNTAPTVTLETQKRNTDSTVLVFSASDQSSVITAARYVLDGGEPVNLLPESGLFDAQDALFRILLDAPKPGPHSIVVEVLDEAGNRGIAQTAFTVEAEQTTAP
jgi:sugar lactone lactonase YvrE